MRTITIVWLVIFSLLTGVSIAGTEVVTKQPDRKLIIGYSGAPSYVDFWRKLKQSLFSKAKDLGVVVVDFSGNDFSPHSQQAALLSAVDKVDGMIVGAVSDKISETMEVFRKKSIPVVAVGVPLTNDWISTTVAIDNNKAAAIAGRFIFDRLKKEKNVAKRVLIFCGDEKQIDARIRASEPRRILSEAGYDVHIYYSEGWSSKNSLADAITELSSNGRKTVAIFSCYADATIASVEAAEAYDLRPVQVGFDMDENIRKMIEAGRLDATITQNPTQMGTIGLETIVKILEGEKTPSKISIPALLISDDNVKIF